ncbi:EAL domain-containing protein [Octadecabacter sp. G9-8]|uniref:EAL domain-containing protein n=1 Tax=Octadecabacter dasysiphoniae TaxID=2909341 RepID=A0ABS9CV39_9RHOB|nr:EAL domain-containing protein [Octadecabacter dasysiphoniae]MCF2870932.1 EAL domain-containing protein [Octadecabacter dasysiphoniae]
MYRIIECLTQEHHRGLVLLAVAICVVGSMLSALLLRRMVHASGQRLWFLWALSSVIGGTTIWSTHFIAMVAFDPGIGHSYEFAMTTVSLGFAAIGLLASNATLTFKKLPWRAPIAGVLFGLTVSGMHYLGMAAYRLPGELIWEPARIVGSIIAGAILGAIAYHRFLHPVTRYCWMGGAIGMILAISAMHFAGMTSFTVFLDSSIPVPEKTLSDLEFGILVSSVTAVIFVVGFTSYSIEINLEKEARGQLYHAAMHDNLTGLPNRLHLSKTVETVNARLNRDATYKAAILSIDLDLFKSINDIHGHAVGDSVLCEIARRFSDVLEENEFLARVGGDEFVAIKHGFRRPKEVTAFANRLHARIVEPIELAQLRINQRASIGMASTVQDGRDLEALLMKSDQAMYRSKTQPNSHLCAFNAEIESKNHEKTVLVSDLRNAVNNNELELVYQLQNSVSTKEPVGFESLLRWNHPERGRISPSVFIPLAEESGLICEIGQWVLREACLTAAAWPSPYSIAVNVAPLQLLQPSFSEQVADALFAAGLSPARLELEVTEASMIDDQAHTLRVMHELKGMGVRVAMDDFGTGYSSLATLQAFPFDKIKIDRSFITNVHLDDQRAAIVRSTLLLGAALGIPVLAEGVENEQELAFLVAEKCNSVQGFYFGKPLSLKEVTDLVQEISTTLNSQIA